MDEKIKKILVIEDNPSDAVLIRDNIMFESPADYNITIAEKLSDGIKAGSGFDAVFIDLWLPDSSGLDTLKKYMQNVPNVPVIVLTGMDNTDISIKAINIGAEDYLVKDYVDGKLLTRAIRYAIERKSIRDSLMKSRLDLTNVIDKVPVMLFMVDKDMTVFKINDTALRYIKSEQSDVLGKHIGKVIKCKNCDNDDKICGVTSECKKCAIMLVISECFKTNTSFERADVVKTLLIGPVPENSYFFMSAIPIEFEGKHSVLVSLEDTTIRRKMEEKTKASIAKLQELDALKSNFISMISHELRTPITSIKGFLAFLLAGAAGPNTETQTEYLEIIRNNSDRLHALINDVLDMSKMESGTFSIEKHSQDAVRVIDRALKDLGSLALKHQINLIKETGVLPLFADMDEFRITQIIVNLVGNAVKFSKEGSDLIVGAKETEYDKLQIPAYADKPERTFGKYILISVKDNGAGIKQEDISRIFDKFYQSNNSDSRVLKGVGLGLNISRNIIKSHSGTIWVESEGKGKGSTFKFILPI